MPTSQAHDIVRAGLQEGEVEQGDPVLFFDRGPHITAG
jgi:hypothetical protein